jgi:hypothetical protein
LCTITVEQYCNQHYCVIITHGREDFCSRRERRERRETTGKKIHHLFISARSAPLRAPLPSGRVLVAACHVRLVSIALGTRFFEHEKKKRKEQDWNLSISPLPKFASSNHVRGMAVRGIILQTHLPILLTNLLDNGYG